MLVMGVWLALLVLPFRSVTGRVLRDRRRARRAPPTGPKTRGMVAWAVQKAHEVVPGRGTCLHQALVAHILLTRTGFEPKLKIGVRPVEGGEIHAHAWVEEAGDVVIGGTRSETDEYSVLPDLERVTLV